uniref:Putative hsc/hsp70-interacting protein n=1 Tax=Corethrella appendiculata TaxID=1370023 RepID=U5EJ47_9DIPT
MSCPIPNQDELNKLKIFCEIIGAKPDLLHLPELQFFKEFIQKFGGKVPPKPETNKSEEKASAKAEEPETEPIIESDPESDVELDNEGVIEADPEDSHEMGDKNKETTEEDMDQASDIRSRAAAAYSEKNYDEAIKLYTEAILLNPHNALFYAKRGQAYLKELKPNACIRDCNRALEINCDSAAAYKFRGRAYRLLGKWEEAAKDLRQACKLDYDEEADEWLKEVTPNAKKLEQHKIKQQRKAAEKELRERQERVRKAQEAKRKAAEEAEQSARGGGGGPNMSDFFGAGGEDILSAFKDPEVAAAMQDVMSNPANISKYQNNPKVMGLLAKISASAGGFPGAGGGFPGAGGGFPGAGGGFPGFGGGAGGKQPDINDDGLD